MHHVLPLPPGGLPVVAEELRHFPRGQRGHRKAFRKHLPMLRYCARNGNNYPHGGILSLVAIYLLDNIFRKNNYDKMFFEKYEASFELKHMICSQLINQCSLGIMMIENNERIVLSSQTMIQERKVLILDTVDIINDFEQYSECSNIMLDAVTKTEALLQKVTEKAILIQRLINAIGMKSRQSTGRK